MSDGLKLFFTFHAESALELSFDPIDHIYSGHRVPMSLSMAN
jgi:hypothetical protein